MGGHWLLGEIAEHIREEEIAVPAKLPPSFDLVFQKCLTDYV